MNGNKRKFAQVDEKKLMRMMAGEEDDDPNNNAGTEKPEDNKKVKPEADEKDEEDVPALETRQEKNSTASRKKRQKADYAETFLRLNKPIEKRPTTIQLSGENYRKIENLLILSPGLSMAMVVNNILESHFEEYAQDVEDVIEARIKKLTKKA